MSVGMRPMKKPSRIIWSGRNGSVICVENGKRMVQAAKQIAKIFCAI